MRFAECDGTNCSIPVNASRAWGSDPGPAVSEPLGVSHVAVVTADLDGFRAFYEETIGFEARGCTNAHPQRSEP
jgi:catechol-2,3-dioxygenase